MGPETVPRMDGKIQLESKEDMKRRASPRPTGRVAWRFHSTTPWQRSAWCRAEQPTRSTTTR